METELMGACQTDLCFAWRAFSQDAAHLLRSAHFYVWAVAVPASAAAALYGVSLRRGWLDHPGGKTVVLPALDHAGRRLHITWRHMRRIYNREQAAARRRRGGE